MNAITTLQEYVSLEHGRKLRFPQHPKTTTSEVDSATFRPLHDIQNFRCHKHYNPKKTSKGVCTDSKLLDDLQYFKKTHYTRTRKNTQEYYLLILSCILKT